VSKHGNRAGNIGIIGAIFPDEDSTDGIARLVASLPSGTVVHVLDPARDLVARAAIKAIGELPGKLAVQAHPYPGSRSASDATLPSSVDAIAVFWDGRPESISDGVRHVLAEAGITDVPFIVYTPADCRAGAPSWEDFLGRVTLGFEIED
jgi:hypothetical protein